MNFLSKLKSSKEKTDKEQEKYIQVMLDFAEGRMSSQEFWEVYMCNESLQNILIKDKMRYCITVMNQKTGEFNIKYDKSIKKPIDLAYDINPDNLLDKIVISKLQHKFELFVIINRYFLTRGIKIKKYNEDVNKYLLLQKLLPNWIEVDDIEYLENIFISAPIDLNEKEKMFWCETKINELFKYDEKPPEWIQSPQWPIVNGTPLVFSRQAIDENNGGHEFFYFYDPETQKETIIEQYD